MLSGCSNTELVPEPVIVEVAGPIQFREIPADLLVQHQPTTIPESISYGEGALLWIEDRAIIKKLLANIAAIGLLGTEPE